MTLRPAAIRRRIAAAQIVGRLDVGQFADSLVRPAHQRPTRARAVAVGRHDVNQAFGDHPLGHVFDVRTHRAAEAAGRELHQAAGVDQVDRQIRLPQAGLRSAPDGRAPR